jgi:hypothetical protein
MAKYPQQQRGGGSGGDNSADEKRNITRAIYALNRNYEATQNEQQEHDKQSLKWNRRVAKAAIAYTVLTALTFIAAAAAVIIARDSEISSIRAYVNSNSLSFITYGAKIDGRKVWHISTLLQNTGNTGTHNMLIHSGVILASVNFDPNKSAFGWEDQRGLPASLLPKSEDIGGEEINLPSNNLEQVSAIGGGHAFAGIGVVRYFDAFSYVHLTEFCYIILVPQADWDDWANGKRLRFHGNACATHNCEDSDCGADWQKRAEDMRLYR